MSTQEMNREVKCRTIVKTHTGYIVLDYLECDVIVLNDGQGGFGIRTLSEEEQTEVQLDVGITIGMRVLDNEFHVLTEMTGDVDIFTIEKDQIVWMAHSTGIIDPPLKSIIKF